MLRSWWRISIGRLQDVRRRSRLMLVTLVSFSVAYLLGGYYLFAYGLTYVQSFPLAGTLIAGRILYLMFAFFFLMLVFSNAIIGYTTLFSSRETGWLLTLPVSHRNVFRWKFFESTILSSWALLFLSAPLMVAYGRVHQAPPLFYLQVILLFVPFVIIPAAIGSCLILVMVRVVSRRWLKRSILILGAALLALGLGFLGGLDPGPDRGMHDIELFNRLMRHTRLSLHPMLPSSWMTEAVVAWSQGLNTRGLFYFLVLLSNAAFTLFLTFEFASRLFYRSWNETLTKRTTEKHQLALTARAPSPPSILEHLIHKLPFSRPMRAMTLKDLRLLWRDPAQWTQFMIFFGLLFIYVLNLRNFGYGYDGGFWGILISFLNLGASALTLATLTTRFVYPQISLEGRRLWILGLAPFGFPRVLLQKFWWTSVAAMAITIPLMLISSMMLRLPPGEVFYFSAAIAIMSFTLCGLSVGLGAIFPDFRQDNPSRIVSGFGGTLCLLASALYILVIITILVLPAVVTLVDPGLSIVQAILYKTAAFIAAVILSLVITIVPMAAAYHRLKTLEL